MELDDLKQSWKDEKITPQINTDIMELIQHKSYGPLAAMKRNFRKEILLMALLPFILALTNADDISKVYTSFMFWSYVAFCISMIIRSYYNYRMVERMENMQGAVVSNLERQLNLLETRLKWNIISLRFVMLYFIIVTEVLPYFQDFRMLRHWHSLPWYARYGTYAGLLLLQFVVSRKVLQRKYGNHIDYLKKLLGEMK